MPGHASGQTNSTRIGIVIPTYNCADQVERLIRSIRAQTYSNYSVVVVDQSSTDRTPEIARSQGCMVVDVPRPESYVPWITDPLPAHSRNLGAQSVAGNILLHLDSDMELGSPDFLEKLVHLIDSQHEAVVIREIDLASGFWPQCKAVERSCYYGTEMEAARAVTRALFDRVGGYDREVSSGEDYFVTGLYQRETQLVRDNSLLLRHHVGRYSLRSLLRKKFVYGRTAGRYLRRSRLVQGRSTASIIGASLGAYIKNWRLFLRHPIQYVCVIPLRVMEFTAIQLGMRLRSNVSQGST